MIPQSKQIQQLETKIAELENKQKSIKIPAGSDLNNYKTEGMYYNDQNTETATIANVPVASAFSLLVEKHAGCKQTFTVYTKDNPRTFIRNCYITWGNWKEISFI